MTINNVLASLAVKDIKQSIQWYENLLGRPATSTPMGEMVEWKFDGGGWLQVYQAKERFGVGSATLTVNNLEEQITALKSLGIEPGQTIINSKVKVVMVKDPDGNSLAFAEALDSSLAN